ncbi:MULTISPECIES: hypothetical protein [Enterobacteriaceae]|uniref:DUF1173 family protein n=1 Tax=Citrobacter telavivensis TaxID=2653932 RepID=A0A6L5EG67_9ENTR|nr:MULTISPECIES: hypothetical protein [Enterobacteriaceae]HDR2614744.1 hypothetical protein [Enterobacter ludwigii]KLV70736.1 hypothetical protein SK37_04986 [Citrobacter sp. MGH109]MDT7093080.1 hypothetical protein [Citrobacter freundii]MPQ54201.1 hypothetical protein [Citrobacter telavivensis]QFS69026.1 hypothetical protein GBC03_01815 [Citrobacter telavivensis]
MAMKLIRKKAPRGGLIRWLTGDEETAVKNISGRKTSAGREEYILAEKVLLEMRQREAWLQCDCVPGDSPAMNSARLMQDTGTLFLAGFNHEHAPECPMYRKFSGDDGATAGGTRKTAGSRRISYRNFLPPDENGARVRAPGHPVASAGDRTRRTRRSRIARLLLSLIEDAGLNRLESLSPLPSRKAIDAINDLRRVAESQEFIRGRQLSDIVRFQPGMTQYGKEQLMESLENHDANWPAGRAHMFFQIFMSECVTRDEVMFSWPGGEVSFRPERGISINGESTDGLRPPYWVILAFRRGTDSKVICSEGYAHALYRRGCPVPVDSGLERKTIDGIAELARWLSRNPDAPVLSLVKPLFDIEVVTEDEKGFVLPDFILNARTNAGQHYRFIIETMGYTDEDYCERKTEQHRGMKTLGHLLTDPPRWPGESDTSLSKYLWGYFRHLDSITPL